MSESKGQSGAVHRLRVREVVTETPDACSFVFDVAPEQVDVVVHLPGQFLIVKIPSSSVGSVARCYSISSASPESEPLTITVKRVPGGYGSNWLCDNVRAGTELEVLKPAGVFTPRSFDRDLLLVAGGSGITPLMSILKSALWDHAGQVALVYANRDVGSVIFGRELDSLTRQYGSRVRVYHWLESERGIPTVEGLRELLAPFAERDIFVCGPAPYMDCATLALHELGVQGDRIHKERFVSLVGNPFEIASAPAHGEMAQVEGAQTQLTVDFEGSNCVLAWPRGAVLLDVLLQNGLDAPYSCREGSCSACACNLVSGEVEMLHNEILDAEDIASGLILACQAVPVTSSVSISYP
ncbi:ferredoxin--NADP reductase [Mycobacterium sp. CVI_P3]|uniref:Ferredoxin--NADP reductase n=1 Tax=Mycobacterium pinniadriaticum TaxID=2994102 RepID=A0ABT3SMV1_9MYCO|nr:ferredoxin--NADP reductase [Mycobacterium pinniadriaticum]MCX2934427.1 ferredoxin--NADP reductase [Mycobacterium pinniadriaticum]MCX2940850.1 ferredoxin--NADP reductase [Mycobacterium pinniadriaticum]